MNASAKSYPVIVELGLLAKVATDIKQRLSSEPCARLVLITDENVGELYAEEFVKSLDAAGFEVDMLVVDPGEASKNWQQVGRICEEMLAWGHNRSSCVIALGGGVIGDLAGFVAAVFMRGIPFVQVPTTMLAMVDASIGGKTGVDMEAGKNLVGAFHQPQAVYIDPLLLRTLPEIELRSGLVEAIKHGLIADDDLLSLIRDNVQKVLDLDETVLLDLISRAAKVKVEIVNQDEKEFGVRKFLNLGHTIGHALEHLSDYELPHGYAVALGLRLESELAVKQGLLVKEDEQVVNEVLDLYELPDKWQRASEFNAEEIWEIMKTDKKNTAGAVVCALLAKVGQGCRVEPIEYDDFLEVWQNFN